MFFLTFVEAAEFIVETVVVVGADMFFIHWSEAESALWGTLSGISDRRLGWDAEVAAAIYLALVSLAPVTASVAVDQTTGGGPLKSRGLDEITHTGGSWEASGLN